MKQRATMSHWRRQMMAWHRGRTALWSVPLLGILTLLSTFAGPPSPHTHGGMMEPRCGATIDTGGLQMALRVPPGPYFLSELLPVHVSLHNHSGHAIWYDGYPSPVPGKSALFVTVTGGAPPLFDLPWHAPFHGPRPPLGTLNAGETLSMDFLVPLTASGAVTLTARGRLLASVVERASVITTTEWHPVPTGWPAVVLHVAAQAPPERILHLHRRGAQVMVTAAQGALPLLLYQDLVTCTGPGQTKTMIGTDDWQPLPADGLREPDCPGTQKHWQVMVSAPGFAIASARY
jgi:hypothetical protein